MLSVEGEEGNQGATYLNILTIAAQTCILRRIRTHYLWSEEQFVHLHRRHDKKMLEVVPSKESEGGDKEATASSKEVVRKGGIENSSPQGKKRTAPEDPETMASKRGKKSSPEGPVLGDTSAELCPQGDQPSTEP